MSTTQLDTDAVQAANSVVNALLALNSAVNFAIYCLVGNKFRRILRQRVLRCGGNSASLGADEVTAPAGHESLEPPAPAAAAPDGTCGLTLPDSVPTTHRLADADAGTNSLEDGVTRNVVVVVVSASDAAPTACSSPTTPSAADELMELSVHSHTAHDDELRDLDLELAAAVHNDDDADEVPSTISQTAT